MRRFLILFLFAFLPNISMAQIGGEDEVYLNAEVINPTFNGGDLGKFYDFINKNFDFTKVTKKGKMVAAFTVTETGELKGIKIVQFLDVESAAEMIRVLKISPKWKPAVKLGKPVSVEIKIPLDFK
ncbi:MAG: hypothetical protein ACI9XR_002156 [Flavobacterium sp.]|jgi:hypothetical protein